jgi:hypothetical protein
MAKPTKQNDLLAAIQRKLPSGEPIPEDPQHTAVKPQLSRAVVQPEAKSSRIGRPVQFWLHEEDRKIIRELAAWLAGQGIRPTDSMVVRAALRVSRTGNELLEAYKQAAELDGRFKRRTA